MAYNERSNSDFVFDITEHLGVLQEYKTGWTKELNLVAWNDARPKFDIRDWSPDHQRMSRGITLHPEEMDKICGMVQARKAKSASGDRQAAASAASASSAPQASGGSAPAAVPAH